jgi:drug/metabolite transporter (DMT)-like permease
MTNRFVYISLVLTALFWSGAFIAGKMAVFIFPPLTLTFFRFLFALPFIFLLLWRKEPVNLLPKPKQLAPLFVLGTIGTLGYHFFFFLSLRYTTAINSSLIGSTNPMITAVLAVIFFKEKISIGRILGIVVSLLGVFCVITGLDSQVVLSLSFNRGDLLMLSGVLCFSLYALLSRKFMRQYRITPLAATAYTFLVCTILSLVLGSIFEKPLAAIMQAESGVWLEILYMAILSSVVGYYFQLNAINQIGAPKTAMFINLVPVFTIVLAATVLGEAISILKITSASLIILGVYLASKPEKKGKQKNLSGLEG